MSSNDNEMDRYQTLKEVQQDNNENTYYYNNFKNIFLYVYNSWPTTNQMSINILRFN